MINIKNVKTNSIKFILIAIAVLVIALLKPNVILSQNYEFSLVPRRAYDQLNVEVWAKSLNPNAARLGEASLVIQYNTSFLIPANIQNLAYTDTIIAIEANSPNPIDSIFSDFNNANGYADLQSTSYSNGFYSLEIFLRETGVLGLQPKTDGRGSFLGIITFNIIGAPQENDLANIIWSRSAMPGNIEVFDVDGNDIKPSIRFVDAPANFTVIGVTLLSPNIDRLVIDRDAIYRFLGGVGTDFYDAGYPIYFERSINPAQYTLINGTTVRDVDENLGYLLEYSTDNGTTWAEIGRVSETSKTVSNTNSNSAAYRAGEIFIPRGASYYITTQTGTQIGANTFRRPLRVIWQKDPFFMSRSEQGKIRVSVLNGNLSTAITARTTSNINATNNGLLILGRLFFVQLNGVNTYLKTDHLYSNATELTVSAWINLNGLVAGSPAIVASSGGPTATPTYGSSEGAWMLYLRNGRIPAFRVRELLGRGNAATPIYLAVCEGYDLDTLRIANSGVLTDEHSQNWVHLAATVKENVASLYVNGELVSQVTNTNANDIRMMTTNHPIWVGVNPNAPIAAGSFLNAGIKGVQVWRAALTQEQIRLYAAGITLPDSISTSIPDDVKKALELYYTLEGTTADLASNAQFQAGRQDILFYNDAMVGQLTPSIPTGNSFGDILAPFDFDRFDRLNNPTVTLLYDNSDSSDSGKILVNDTISIGDCHAETARNDSGKNHPVLSDTPPQEGNSKTTVGKKFPSMEGWHSLRMTGWSNHSNANTVEENHFNHNNQFNQWFRQYSGKNNIAENNIAGKSKDDNQFQASEPVSANYRPDQPHLYVTSPAKGAGVLNKTGDNTEIRWITYGMTDINKPAGLNSGLNFEIEYSIDGGESWTVARNPSNQTLTGNNIPQSNLGVAVWQPFLNNAPAANLRTINPYSKQAQIRLKGIASNGQTAFTSISDTFTIAPHFALSMGTGSQLRVGPKMGMNITGDFAYIEAWIKPYRFPNAQEGFFPIVQKSDAIVHYALRLHSNGTLSFLVTDRNGVVFTAATTPDFALLNPNSIQADSAWTHIAVLFIKSNSNDISEARFYIDGNVQGGTAAAQQFTQLIQLNTQNEYALYVGSNPTLTNSFVGEIKEVRFWNGVPNNYSVTGTEPTEFTQFVRKAQAEVIKDFNNAFIGNLHSYFTMEGGTFVVNGNSRAAAISDRNAAVLNHYGTTVKFMPFVPFIKLVEPQLRQPVANTDTNVKIRWVGLYYDGTDFFTGSGNPRTPPSLEYSINGGGGVDVQPYQYVGSLYWGGNTRNSIRLLQTNDYYSQLSNRNKFIGFSLDASRANPDVNRDGINNDQGPLSPTLTNARLRLTGSFTINGEKMPLQTEGPLFTITPASNFTVRIMLEGYHQGNTAGRRVNQLGSTYDLGGLRIKLYSDNSDEVAAMVGSEATSIFGYTDTDPANLNRGNNRFGNVEFVFTDVANGSYWLLVEHINHLPIMSRRPAPFLFTGDIPTTWGIESGWDFMSWNGVDYNIMPGTSTDSIWIRRYYTARGTAVNNAATNADHYATTGLIFNGGNTAATGLAGMVGGDVNQDKMINAADRVKVRQDAGTMSYQSDITGDRFVNAVDRTITDKNFGKVSSLFNVNIPGMIANSNSVIDPFNAVDYSDVGLSRHLNRMAKLSNYTVGNNPKDSTVVIRGENHPVLTDTPPQEGNCKTTVGKKFPSMEGWHSLRMTGWSNHSNDATVEENHFNHNNQFNQRFRQNSSRQDSNTEDSNRQNSNTENNIASKNKEENQLQAISYIVSAQANYDESGYVDLSMYIRNLGDQFALANCSFSISFDTEVLNFVSLLGADSVMFNSHFDYNNFNNNNDIIPDNGYLKLSSAPQRKDSIYDYVRTIEVDYDAFSNIGGINVPNANTYLGTLRFKVSNNAGIISFKWHESKAVLTTKGQDVTDDGRWDTIPTILLYKLKLTQPTGGEKYSVLRQEMVRWTTTGTANIFVEFSSNNGFSWQRLTSEAISSASLSYAWTTPDINSSLCLIRILDATTGIEVSRSDSVFSITRPWGRIDHPTTTPTPFIGNSKTLIEWAAGGTDCVKFEFSSDGGITWSSVSGTYNATSGAGKTNWTVPRVTTQNARIRMLDCGSNFVLAVSEPFTIFNGSVTFTRPLMNQLVFAGDVLRVQWTFQDVEEFELQVSIDNGRTWQRVELNVLASLRSMNWSAIVESETDSAMFRALYQGNPLMEYGRSNRFRIKHTSIFDSPENCIVSNIFPNPTNDIASIIFDFRKPTVIDIKLIDISGSLIKELMLNEFFDIGIQKFAFDISGISSGKYYVLITSKEFIVLREITISK